MDFDSSTIDIDSQKQNQSLTPPQKYINNVNETTVNLFSHHQENFLLDAASRIFATLTQLQQSHQYHDIQQLRNYLLNELALFKEQAQKLEYTEETLLISQYALSATLDEMISKTTWGNKAQWMKHNLLQELHENSNADEHFFVILNKTCLQSTDFIDAIELMYICLSLGFEGKFKHHPLEKQRLHQITNHTYQIIRTYRGEFNKALTPHKLNIGMRVTPKKKHRSIPWYSMIVFSSLVIIGMYFGFNYLLQISAAEANQQLATIPGINP